MNTLQDTISLADHIDVSPPRNTDDDKIPDERARALLREILPPAKRAEFDSNKWILIEGKRHRYEVSAGTTKVFHKASNRLVEYACLQLTVPAPHYDRMIVEYLLLTNDERTYRAKANRTRARTPTDFWRDLLVMMFFLIDGALLTSLLPRVMVFFR